jgi:ParB family chromosome partitioning protein
MSLDKKRGLGKGLSALLDDSTHVNSHANISRPISTSPEINDAGSINEIRISEIEVNPFQPRTEFEAQALNELADSIKAARLNTAHYR